MGVYQDYPRGYPKRKDPFDRDQIKHGSELSNIPTPKPPVFKNRTPLNELGKDPLPVISSSKPSKIPVPKRLSSEQDDLEGTLTTFESRTFLNNSVYPSTGAHSSKPVSLNVAITPLDVPKSPVKVISSTTKSIFTKAILESNIASNVDRIVEEVNYVAPILDDFVPILDKEKNDEQKTATAPSSTGLSDSSSLTCTTCTSSERVYSSSSYSDIDYPSFATNIRGITGQVRDSETTYFPESTAHNSERSLVETSESEIEERDETLIKVNDGALIKMLSEIEGASDDDMVEIEVSKKQLEDLLKSIEYEREEIEKEIARLTTAPNDVYTCVQLALQGVFASFVDKINWSNINLNNVF